jgi:hypothetical protein
MAKIYNYSVIEVNTSLSLVNSQTSVENFSPKG